MTLEVSTAISTSHYRERLDHWNRANAIRNGTNMYEEVIYKDIVDDWI